MEAIIAEFKRNVLGPCTVGFYLSAFFFSLIGLLIMLYYRSTKRNKLSAATPVHFSLGFLVWDSAKKLGAGLLVMYVLFRFSTEFLHGELSMRLALFIGFGFSLGLEPVLEGLMNKYESVCSLLSMPREQYMSKLVSKAETEVANQNGRELPTGTDNQTN